MKVFKQLTAWLMSLTLAACLLPAAPVYSEGASFRYYIDPILGDGASIDEETLDSLYVVGTLSSDRKTFTYTESRVLSFTVTLEEGWQYSATYSQIFKGDEAHVSITGGETSVTVTYNAVSGRSIAFSSLRNVGIYTSAEELPKMYLTIDGDWDSVDKVEWVDAQINLQLGTKAYTSGNYIGACQVKGRGNMSWGKNQKPYSINFEKKTSLLDFPKIKKYCIVSNNSDGSKLRNLITYQTYQELDGIGYVVHAELVRVFLNGKEEGIYTLSERLRISDNQIPDVQADKNNVTGGYVMEKSVLGKRDDNDIYFKAPYHGHSDEDIMMFKDPDEPTADMLSYVQSAVNTMHNAIMSDSQTAYQNYVDTDSWADFLIVQEVAKNPDGELKTSCFMYLPSGSQTFEFASPWDFDIAYDNDGTFNNNGGWRYSDGTRLNVTDSTNTDDPVGWMVITDNCAWFKTLYTQKPAFKRAVQETYTKYRYTVLEDLINNTYKYAAYLGDDASNSGTNALISWLERRLAWLDTQWLLSDYDAPACDIKVNIKGDGLVTCADGDTGSAEVGDVKTYTFTPIGDAELFSVKFAGRDVTDELVGNTYTTPYITDDAKLTVTFLSEYVNLSGVIKIMSETETVGGFTVSLTDQGGTVVASQVADGANYTFTNIPSDVYTLTISKANYISDEEELELYYSVSDQSNKLYRWGDVDLNGDVSAADLTALAGHVCKIAPLTKAKSLKAAAMTRDKPCAADITKVARYIANGGCIPLSRDE